MSLMKAHFESELDLPFQMLAYIYYGLILLFNYSIICFDWLLVLLICWFYLVVGFNLGATYYLHLTYLYEKGLGNLFCCTEFFRKKVVIRNLFFPVNYFKVN